MLSKVCNFIILIEFRRQVPSEQIPSRELAHWIEHGQNKEGAIHSFRHQTIEPALMTCTTTTGSVLVDYTNDSFRHQSKNTMTTDGTRFEWFIFTYMTELHALAKFQFTIQDN